MPPRAADIRYQESEVAERYDAARFHGLRGRYNNWRLHSMLGAVMKTLPRPGLVLDMPCGTGRLAAPLTRATPRVIAADMLAVARRKVGRLPVSPRFLRADARALPLRAGVVDVAVCVRFLHLLDPESRVAVLRELMRVSRHAVVVEYRSVTKGVRVLRRAAMRWAGRRDVRRNTTLADIAAELGRAGLTIDRASFVSRWFSASVLILARPDAGESRRPLRERFLSTQRTRTVVR
jgi:ubiquinone/menaquinone biosynthesis C-methylase UbiE